MIIPRLNYPELIVIVAVSGSLFLLAVYWYFKQKTTRRRVETMLQQQTNRERLVNQIAQHIRKSLDVDEVMATTVSEVQSFLQADRVLIYRLWNDGTGSAIYETVLPPYPEVLGQTFPPEVFPQEYHQAYSLGKTRTITQIDQTDVEPCLADFVKQFGVQAKLVVPIIQENRDSEAGNSQTNGATASYLWGLLIAHQCSRPRKWEDWEVELMQHLATQVAIAIQQSELYNQLQQLNAELECRVQQRTAELAAANASLRVEIAERQRSEAALRRTNDTLQALVIASPRAIIMLNREGNVQIWNPAAEQMFGWTEAEVIDRPNPLCLEDPESDCATLQSRVLQGATYFQSEFRQKRKDGTLIDIIFSAAPLRDSDEQISGLVAVIADVTEQKRQAEQVHLAEQALRQSEERFRSLIENALDIIMILGPDGAIGYVSPSVEKILGYSVADLVGKNVAEFIHPDDWVTTRDHLISIEQPLELRRPIEFRSLHHDSSWHILEAVSQPFVDSGESLRIIVNARDITERKRLDEIRSALEREKELSILKTRFFSMASHEFRTPLSTTLAAAQVLETCQDEWTNAEKRLRNLHRIQDSVRNMVQLLDDILTINRAEAGKLTFSPGLFNLETLCHKLVEEMRLNAGTQHVLTFTCEGKVVPVYLDEKLVTSILTNLLSNAIKYSPQGGTIHLSLIFQSNRVLLQVEDQGIGIPQDDQSHLFEPFHRGKNVRSISGSGLGLVVVKKCIDLHQGTIHITSEVGKGTICLVSLPSNPSRFPVVIGDPE
ncbi:PAS domain S-box protein [Leptothermofonsia sichuanensis E412]|uniref:PAS domain S-box protein n=1 Tax=Leptothermofonsia sichuanensis TaxID=2917832 RepID=UPI001CA672F0|nr:PAS domain S-box protein [Leptothermofonsia sichuanensis]QZZ21775.1 PAS domain S-box protein [Leptothermofonsia sichuanensis E412]